MAEPFTDSTFNCVAFAQEYGQLMRKIERAASGDGIGAAEGRVLLAVDSAPIAQADLARKLLMDTGQLARLCHNLEQKGLIDRRAMPGETQAALCITPNGSKAAIRLSRAQFQASLDLSESMSAFERERFLASVKYLTEHLVTGDYSIDVRDAMRGETGAIVEQSAGLFGGGFFGHDAAEVAASLHHYFANHAQPESLMLVAAQQRHLAGTICISTIPDTRQGKIHLFCIFSHYMWGRGFGKQLLDHAIDRSRENGLQSLSAEFPVYDDDARYLADRPGWELFGTQQKQLSGRQVKMEYWELEL